MASSTTAANVAIRLVETDDEILACYSVLSELRPHVPREGFVERIRNLQKTERYQLAYATKAESQEQGKEGSAAAAGAAAVVAVGGFALMDNLAFGKLLYVHDLVTSSEHRSRGYGSAMLDWLKGYAAQNYCRSVQLDSKTHRKDAHRFYEREGLPLVAYHFSADLDDVGGGGADDAKQ